MNEECVLNSDCSRNQACIQNHCADPCPGLCGTKAICRVINHNPVCTCPYGYTGNAFTNCYAMPQECVLNNDCPRDYACLRSQCTNPCDGGLCAPSAVCSVINHNPVCNCPSGMEGDPFVQCRTTVQPEHNDTHGPCTPNPCGSFAQCREMNDQAVCSCLSGYLGSPPTCRPQCTLNSDCPNNQACINQKCSDPCHLSCGKNSECKTIDHQPFCNCMPKYTGNAYADCYPIGK